jgi:hypothetical protein
MASDIFKTSRTRLPISSVMILSTWLQPQRIKDRSLWNPTAAKPNGAEIPFDSFDPTIEVNDGPEF